MKTKTDSAPLQLRRGDWVFVRPAQEILRTLDANGTLDGLPFMPEMLSYCGKRYQVSSRVIQAVLDGAALGHHAESFVRAFHNDDVVVLEMLRCAGSYHGGCRRGCRLFWKEAWLRKTEPVTPHSNSLESPAAAGALSTTTAEGRFFCQSTEFRNATRHLTGAERVVNCIRTILIGNCGPLEMVRQLGVWLYWRIHRTLRGEWPRGTLTTTPTAILNLQPGEWVEIKSLAEIEKTLDIRGRNRGLHFSPDMARFCGRQLCVRSRAEPLIAEVTGEVKSLRNTVILEEAFCDSATYAFGGCPRADYMYWREIWLQRVKF